MRTGLIQLNLGGGPKRVEGYKNVDILDWNGVTDILWDLTKTPYEFVNEPVDEILAMEFLEHISWRDTDKVLAEWYRILKPRGRVSIQVPAIDRMCEMFVRKEICQCCSHKPKSFEDARGKKSCWECQGRGKVNPVRWLMAFCGAQKHIGDYHKNIFTKDILRNYLENAGFKNIDIKYDKYDWKLIANCVK